MGVFSARSFWLPVLLATLVAAFFGAVLARRGRTLERLLREQKRLEARMRQMEAENARLRAERDALLSSPEAVERVAREDYGFSAPGEQVEEYPGLPRATEVPLAPEPVPLWASAFGSRAFPVLLAGAVFVLSALLAALWNALRPASETPGS
ncbi:MAG: septum formation initiator family protein [Candidatus Brocadiia bacterium]